MLPLKGDNTTMARRPSFTRPPKGSSKGTIDAHKYV